jgi:hypothetical protein
MCLRRAPEKYIAGAALDRAALVGFEPTIPGSERATTVLYVYSVHYDNNNNCVMQRVQGLCQSAWTEHYACFRDTVSRQKLTLSLADVISVTDSSSVPGKPFRALQLLKLDNKMEGR